MAAYVLYILASLYLGLLTSISPCPLATNIAAVSYVGRKVGSPRAVIGAGLLYTIGRCAVYVGLAVFLVMTAASIPAVSRFLQSSMHIVLAPLFLVVGMFLVGLIQISIGGSMISEGIQKRIDAMGVWGSLVLGALFALSFCPTSAAWFFGLITLMMGAEAGAITTVLTKVGISLPEAALPASTVVLPSVYGLGTATPVILVALLLAYSAQSVGKAYNALGKIEWGARQATGWVFIVIGAHFALKYVFDCDCLEPLRGLFAG